MSVGLWCVFIFYLHVHEKVYILTVFIRKDFHTCSKACQLPIHPPSQSIPLPISSSKQ